MILIKLRGSLTKEPGRRGYVLIWAVGFGSSGSDLMETRSNLTRPFRIGWPGFKGGDGGGAGRREIFPAAAPRRRRPNPAFPWQVWTAAWPWGLYVACVVHWGSERGSTGVLPCCRGPAAAEQWRVRRRSSGARRSSHRSVLCATILAQTERGRRAGAHRARNRDGEVSQGSRRRGCAAEVGRSSWRSRCRASPVLLVPRSGSGVACEGSPRVRAS